MIQRTDRILTTHVGSLPRTEAECEMLLRKEHSQPYEQAEFDQVIHQATMDVACGPDRAASRRLQSNDAPDLELNATLAPHAFP